MDSKRNLDISNIFAKTFSLQLTICYRSVKNLAESVNLLPVSETKKFTEDTDFTVAETDLTEAHQTLRLMKGPAEPTSVIGANQIEDEAENVTDETDNEEHNQSFR